MSNEKGNRRAGKRAQTHPNASIPVGVSLADARVAFDLRRALLAQRVEVTLVVLERRVPDKTRSDRVNTYSPVTVGRTGPSRTLMSLMVYETISRPMLPRSATATSRTATANFLRSM